MLNKLKHRIQQFTTCMPIYHDRQVILVVVI